MVRLTLAAAALMAALTASAYTAKCHIDIPGQKPVIVVGEVTEHPGGIVVIRTPYKTYRTHMARVVIVLEQTSGT